MEFCGEQADLPAEQPATGQDARVPSSDAYPCRSGDHRRAPAQGSRPAVGLTVLGTGTLVLPAAARMRRPAEFAAAVRSGARAGSRALTVHVAATTSTSAPGAAAGVRVGFVVPRAVGSAVVRNGVRRRLRHVLRARLDGLPRGVDVVVRVHPAAAAMSSTALGSELDRTLQRAPADAGGSRS